MTRVFCDRCKKEIPFPDREARDENRVQLFIEAHTFIDIGVLCAPCRRDLEQLVDQWKEE